MDKTTLGPHDAPRAARRAVTDCCAEAGAGPVCTDSTELMTSEIVTNALLHGSGPVSFGVDCDGPNVRVEVGDDNSSQPRFRGADADRDADADRESGRGMMIVDALASDWGVDDGPAGGKTVWFEVPVEP